VRDGVDRNIGHPDGSSGMDILLVQIVSGFAAWVFLILLVSLMAAIHTYTQPETIFVTVSSGSVTKKIA
jgi:hypothetical protein